jgi:pimeloyl-ACP methyl ester carboxylesterase
MLRAFFISCCSMLLFGQEQVFVFAKGSVTVEGVVFPYQYLRPITVGPDRLPFLVFLHGAGERGTDNELQLKWFCRDMATKAMVQKHPCFLLAVQCPLDRMWVPVSFAERQSRALAPDLSLPQRAVLAAMQTLMQTHADEIDLDRVYLTGLSMGGFGCWDFAMRDPYRFAALAPVCGGGDELQAHRLLGLPIWNFHGANDSAVPVARSRSMIQSLRAFGHPARYTELPGVGHDSWLQAYGKDGVIDWLFAQDRRTDGRGAAAGFAVLPLPEHILLRDGEFVAAAGMCVCAAKELAAPAELLAALLQRCTGIPVKVVHTAAQKGCVELLMSAEGAREVVFDDQVAIVGRELADFWRGVAVVVQALGSRPGFAAPHGVIPIEPDRDLVTLVLDMKVADISDRCFSAVVERCFWFAIPRIQFATEPSEARHLLAASMGITLCSPLVATGNLLPIRELSLPAKSDSELLRALPVALPLLREAPSAERLPQFHVRLANAARTIGW